MKLKGKMVLSTVLICIFSILSVSIIDYVGSIRKLEQEVNEKVQLETMNIAKDIDKWMAIQKDTLYDVVDSIAFNNNYEYDYLHNYLIKANNRYPEKDHYILFSDGFYVDAIGWVPDDVNDIATQSWYTESIGNDEVFVSEPYFGIALSKMVVTISKFFKTLDGREGAVGCDILS